MRQCSAPRSAAAIGLLMVCLPSLAFAQVSKSAAVAKELAAALDSKKLDAVAAKLPSDPNRYAAVLYFPGAQMMVIAGPYSAPQLLDPRLDKKEYRDVYMELSGTVPKDGKIFVMDMGAPGLAAKKVDGYSDSWTKGDKQVTFDGDPGKQKMSDADYEKSFAAADEEYAKILGALLAEAKK